MKERYIECTGRLFIREVKKHWWSKWKIDNVGGMPIIYLMYQHNQQSIYIPYYCGLATPQKEKEEMKQQLLELGWVDKGDVIVRYSEPRLGWKPADGTLIIGYHEVPEKVFTLEDLRKAISPRLSEE